MKLNKNSDNTMQSPQKVLRSAIIAAVTAAFLMLVPLLAMEFTDEVVWTLIDFVIAWTLLFSAGFAYLLIAGKMKNIVYRGASALSVGTALFLVWSNLAVGVIGSENNPANLMYLGVLAIFITGALLSHFRPYGMARTLFATALAQALVGGIALIANLGYPVSPPIEIIIVSAFFIILWIGSGLLFLYTAQKYPSTS